MADSGTVEGTSLRAVVGGQTTPKAPTGQRWLPPNARDNVDGTELLYRKIRGYMAEFVRTCVGICEHVCVCVDLIRACLCVCVCVTVRACVCVCDSAC